MTDNAETAPSSAQLDRIAQLRAKRAQTTPLPASQSTRESTVPTTPTPVPSRRRRKRHVAQGSRIMAAGLGAATMFGIVGVLGLDHPYVAGKDSVTAPHAVTVSSPAPTQVGQIPVTLSTSPAAQPGNVDPTGIPAAASTPAAPIVLTANPVVQTVTVAAPAQTSAASATTRGSN